jgi:hypothetical protein
VNVEFFSGLAVAYVSIGITVRVQIHERRAEDTEVDTFIWQAFEDFA